MSDEYRIGYYDGESSMYATWTFAMNELAGVPDEFSGDIDGVAAYVKALMSVACDSSEQATREVERRARLWRPT